MANPLAKTLIAIVASCVAAGSVAAQGDLFNDAIRKLRTGDPAAALEKLNEYLATNPGNEEAFALWQKTDSAVWQMLIVENKEFAAIARHLMDQATQGRREVSRDADRIAELVSQATTGEDFGTRSHAMATLAAEHSEFAVPALTAILGDEDSDSGQNLAILALKHIGSPAVMPLVEALASKNDLLRRNIAASLVHIGDRRAASALARMASNDNNEAVREIARNGLAKFGVAAGSNPVESYLKDAQDYLTGDGLRGHSISEVVWTFGEGGLESHDVPSAVYHLELAKKAAHEALRLDPASDAAKTLLARSYLAEVAAIKEVGAANPDDEGVQALQEKVPALRMVAMATGPATLRSALTDSLNDRMHPAAIACIEALGETESVDTLGSSPLLAALDNDNRAVGYAAALAMSDIGGGKVPNSGRVVELLGQAVAEEGRRLVKVIGGGAVTQKAVENASGKRGLAVSSSFNGRQGISDIYSQPDHDVVVVNEELEFEHPRHVISLIRKRSPNAKILLLTSNEDAASEQFSEIVDGFIAGGISADVIEAKANELVAEFEPRRAAANAVAVRASNALHSLASNKIDVAGALKSLEAQLSRPDAVAIPAAGALGAGGNSTNLAGLAAVLGGEGSGELKVACAHAIGAILGRSDSVPTQCFEQMTAIASDAEADAGLRAAVVTALGKGTLAPGERLKIAEMLSTIASSGSVDL